MSNIASIEGVLQALRYHKIDKSFIPAENVFDFIIETLEEYQQLKERSDDAMNITYKEFDAIKKALELLPKGAGFTELSPEEQRTIVDADVVMMNLLKKKERANKRTAEYIAGKRKTNKNYAR